MSAFYTRTTKVTVEGELGRAELFAQMLVDKTERLWEDDMVKLGPEYMLQQHNALTEELDALAREILYTVSDLHTHVKSSESAANVGVAA